MHKVFVSYHHANDQCFKQWIVEMANEYSSFIDRSVDIGDIDKGLSDQQIRKIIRDEYLRDSTVTIVLVGSKTAHRKHIDWEIYSSMFDGPINKKSGIVVVNLPYIKDAGRDLVNAPHLGEKQAIYRDIDDWASVTSRAKYERIYPSMPARIIDNLINSEAKISVVGWNRICRSPARLNWLIDAAFRDRGNCRYDLSQHMIRKNS